MLEIKVSPGDGQAMDLAGLAAALTALPSVERVEQVQPPAPGWVAGLVAGAAA